MVKSTTGNLKNPRHRRDSITCLCKRLLYTNKSRDSDSDWDGEKVY